MKSWFLVMHNLNGRHFENAVRRLDMLGVEPYSPVRLELKKRSDCSSTRPVQKALFPGYLFLRFNPEEVHTTTISDLHGMKGFVRVGHELARLSDFLIEALKYSLLCGVGKGVKSAQFRSLPAGVQEALSEIVAIESSIKREIALLKLLEKLSKDGRRSTVCPDVSRVS